MRWRQTTCRYVLAAAIVLSVAILARTAPLGMAPRRKLPDSIRTLANVDRVRLVVQQVPAELRAAKITHGVLERRIKSLLRRFGIEVDESKDAAPKDMPQLQIITLAITEQDVPDAIAFLVAIRFHQPINIERIGEGFYAPTYANMGGGLEEKSNIGNSVLQVVDALINFFGESSRQATKQANRQ